MFPIRHLVYVGYFFRRLYIYIYVFSSVGDFRKSHSCSWFFLNFSFYFQSKFYFSFYFNNYQKDYRFIKLLCGYCIEICGCPRVFTPTGSERIGDEVGPQCTDVSHWRKKTLRPLTQTLLGWMFNLEEYNIYIHPMSSTPSNPPHLNSSCK